MMQMSTENKSTREPKRRVHHFAMLKQRSKKIVVVTAYDFPTGLAADAAGADAVLVGDSLGMVALGFDSTIPVTMAMMIHHTAAVHRAVKRAFLIADMPFLSYKSSPEKALLNAGILLQRCGAEAVKMEGGQEIAQAVEKVVSAGIPVMGHIGLIPQSVHQLGGYRVQGRQDESAEKLIRDAQALEKAGAFSIVLEAMDPQVANDITSSITIPTIGIGAGRACDGQVLVLSDLAGLTPATPPRFAKQYTGIFNQMTDAIHQFAEEVRSGEFPQERNEY
jgi:3-methyl-2-oxobutanoate hydroxymethyltransferase